MSKPEFALSVEPKFSPLLLVLLPSELLVLQLLEDVLSVLDENDFELTMLTTFPSVTSLVSERDFVLDF